MLKFVGLQDLSETCERRHVIDTFHSALIGCCLTE